MKKTILLRLSLLLLGALFAAVSLPAQAQTRAEVQELRAKVDGLLNTNQKNYQDVARAMSLLTQIQQEFQSIRGTLDSSKYIQQESDKVYQDLDLRVSALEDKVDQVLKLVKEMRATAPAAGDKPGAPAVSRELDEFQAILQLASAQDFTAAASGFLGFLKKYPQSEYGGSAQFWVGESYYSLGDYAKAISEFQRLNEKYPQHPKVKEAVYKQGLSFMRLKKYPEAKLFFQKVIGLAPASPEALQAKARLFRIEELEKGGATVAVNNLPAAPAGAAASASPVSVSAPVTPPSAPPAAEGNRPAGSNSNAPLF